MKPNSPEGQELLQRSLPLRLVAEQFSEAILEIHSHCGDDTAIVARQHIAEICRFLKDTPSLAFNMLVDITGADYLPRSPRFEVIYHFLSLTHRHRVRIKVQLDAEDPVLPSVTALYGSANWAEREVWDMFGIRFDGHPDLRRILMYEQFEGHPLRKDYPLRQRQPLIGPLN